MNRYLHIALITFYFLVVVVVLSLLIYFGLSYYQLPIEERFFHPMYQMLKPSGFLGHGYGVFGTLLIVIGLFSYMARKHLRIFWGLGLLKHWLELHIFLCTLGTELVVFHTTFKFGGLVSVGFWSLMIVWFSGLIGRFIYIQIPLSIEGRMLSIQEVQEKIENLESDHQDERLLKKLRRQVKHLGRMKRVFKRWHYAHLPFALIMLIIMMIHVSVVLVLGYKWIF
ncbi:MAG TPA: hypothetical protein VFP20_11335 [Bacteroidales bacterium]|nr:hypothetical protein [Bacteroidales bacterium]